MTKDVFRLNGRVAIVTGGGTGIGKATSMLLARQGARVVIASRREENLVRTVEDIGATGGTAAYRRTDVRDLTECQRLADFAIEEFGSLDIVVNNAGGSKVFPLAAWPAEEYERSIRLNFGSVFHMSNAAFKHMQARRSGCIVNISSLASHLAMPNLGPYGPIKAAVNHLTRVMAAEYGPFGVRVNCVSCGFVKTEGLLRAVAPLGRSADEIGAESNALGRAGTPEEIAYAVLFLASDASSFVTGETIYVGGGQPASGPW